MAQAKNLELNKAARDNKANQGNPNNDAYKTSRGYPSSKRVLTQAENDLRSRQLNEKDELYRKARGC